MQEDLRELFRDYVAEADTLDFAHISKTWDLRASGYTWKSLGQALGVPITTQMQGFPSIGDDDMRVSLLQFCEADGVTSHEP